MALGINLSLESGVCGYTWRFGTRGLGPGLDNKAQSENLLDNTQRPAFLTKFYYLLVDSSGLAPHSIFSLNQPHMFVLKAITFTLYSTGSRQTLWGIVNSVTLY